jgi:hypothetical protein
MRALVTGMQKKPAEGGRKHVWEDRSKMEEREVLLWSSGLGRRDQITTLLPTLEDTTCLLSFYLTWHQQVWNPRALFSRSIQDGLRWRSSLSVLLIK